MTNLIVTPTGVVEADTYAGSCRCGGTKNLKYNKGKYLIYFLPKKQVYHIKEANQYIVRSQPIATLCQKLESLGLPACVESSNVN